MPMAILNMPGKAVAINTEAISSILVERTKEDTSHLGGKR